MIVCTRIAHRTHFALGQGTLARFDPSIINIIALLPYAKVRGYKDSRTISFGPIGSLVCSNIGKLETPYRRRWLKLLPRA